MSRSRLLYREVTTSVDLIIPTYNQPDMLKRCLRSVRANTHVPYGLIISDDNSPDPKMRTYLDGLQHDYNVLRNDKQLGFPANVNQAVEFSDADYICLLNSDTRVCVGWLEAMLEEMEPPDVGVVGCKLVYPNEKEPPWGGTIQHAGVAKDERGPFHIWRGMPKEYPPANMRREVNCVTFACTLIRRTLWDELEGLDEGYRGGQFEDVAFCWTARQLGWKVIYTPKCVVYHYEHGSGEEWVKKSEPPNRKRLDEQFPNQPDDVQLYETLDKTTDGIAAFVHQIRSAAIFHTIGFRDKLDHPLRLATMSYDELPEVEKAWAREHAKRLLEVLK